jgi:hypothetical protein
MHREMSRMQENAARLEAASREKDRIIAELQTRVATAMVAAVMPQQATAAATTTAAPGPLRSAMKPSAVTATAAAVSVASAAAAGAAAVPRFAQPTASSQASVAATSARLAEKENRDRDAADGGVAPVAHEVRFATKPFIFEEAPPARRVQQTPAAAAAPLSPGDSRRNTRSTAAAAAAAACAGEMPLMPGTPGASFAGAGGKTREQLLNEYLESKKRAGGSAAEKQPRLGRGLASLPALSVRTLRRSPSAL